MIRTIAVVTFLLAASCLSLSLAGAGNSTKDIVHATEIPQKPKSQTIKVQPHPPVAIITTEAASADLISKGCQNFLGRKSEFQCKSQSDYQTCVNYLKHGALTYCGWAGHDFSRTRAGSPTEAAAALNSAGCQLDSKTGLWNCPANREFVCAEYRNDGAIKGCTPHCQLRVNSGSSASIVNGELKVLLYLENTSLPGGCLDLDNVKIGLPYLSDQKTDNGGPYAIEQYRRLDPNQDPKKWGTGLVAMDDMDGTGKTELNVFTGAISTDLYKPPPPPDWWVKRCADPPQPPANNLLSPTIWVAAGTFYHDPCFVLVTTVADENGQKHIDLQDTAISLYGAYKRK